MSEYAFHPHANFFPLMEGGEFAALVEDIRAHGLHEPIVLFENMILDGRNRDRACHEAGVEPQYRGVTFGDHAEAIAFVISRNIHRRNLTAEQNREIVAKLLKAAPEQSDRHVARTAHVSPTTVGRVREDLEQKGDVSKVDTSLDTKGRNQPRRRSKKSKESLAGGAGAAPAEPTGREASSDDPAVSAERMKAVHTVAEQAEATPDGSSQGNTPVEEPSEPVDEAQAEMSEPAEDIPETALADNTLEAALANDTQSTGSALPVNGARSDDGTSESTPADDTSGVQIEPTVEEAEADDLNAAQQRIAELEARIEELEIAQVPTGPDELPRLLNIVWRWMKTESNWPATLSDRKKRRRAKALKQFHSVRLELEKLVEQKNAKRSA
jgi:ParB-like chromosome segregation protein Spo0J